MLVSNRERVRLKVREPVLLLVLMTKQNTKEKAAPESCDHCPRWQELKEERVRLAQLISKARQGFEARLEGSDLKLTLADYLKLIQMEKEIDDGKPREIKVTWVNSIPASKPEK
jgi:hypothetical protein